MLRQIYGGLHAPIPPTIYVAGSFARCDVVLEAMNLLRGRGFFIAEDWTRQEDKSVPDAARNAYLGECAIRDLAGVERSDAVLVIADPEWRSFGSGVEVGAALSQRKPVIIAGRGHTSVFTKHPLVFGVESVTAAVNRLSLIFNQTVNTQNSNEGENNV